MQEIGHCVNNCMETTLPSGKCNSFVHPFTTSCKTDIIFSIMQALPTYIHYSPLLCGCYVYSSGLYKLHTRIPVVRALSEQEVSCICIQHRS